MANLNSKIINLAIFSPRWYMRRCLRSRRPDGGQPLTPQPSPLTTNPSRNQAMLNHSQENHPQHPSAKSQCVSHPPTLRTSMRKGAEPGPGCLALPIQRCQRTTPLHKKTDIRLNRKRKRGEREVLCKIRLQFLQDALPNR